MGLRFSRLCASKQDIFNDDPSDPKSSGSGSGSSSGSSGSSNEDYIYIADPSSLPDINARPRTDGRRRMTLPLDQIEGSAWHRHYHAPPRILRTPPRLSNRPRRMRSQPILRQTVRPVASRHSVLPYQGLVVERNPWATPRAATPRPPNFSRPRIRSQTIPREPVRSVPAGPDSAISPSQVLVVPPNPRAVSLEPSDSCCPRPRRPPMPSFTYSAPSGFSCRTMSAIMEDEEHSVCTLPMMELRSPHTARHMSPTFEPNWEYVRPGAQSRAGYRSEDRRREGEEVEGGYGQEHDLGTAWCEYSWGNWVLELGPVESR